MPRIAGNSNSPIVAVPTKMMTPSSPGSITGSVMRRAVVRISAPDVAAASSSAGSMLRKRPTTIRKIVGVRRNASTTTSVPSVYGLNIPFFQSSHCVKGMLKTPVRSFSRNTHAIA